MQSSEGYKQALKTGSCQARALWHVPEKAQGLDLCCTLHTGFPLPKGTSPSYDMVLSGLHLHVYFSISLSVRLQCNTIIISSLESAILRPNEAAHWRGLLCGKRRSQ